MRTIPLKHKHDRSIQTHPKAPEFTTQHTPALLRIKPQPGQKIMPKAVPCQGIFHFRRKARGRKIPGIQMLAFQRRRFGRHHNRSQPGSLPERQHNGIRLLVAGRSHVEQLVIVVIHDRNACQRGRYPLDQTLADFLADLTTTGTRQRRKIARLNLRQFLHATFGTQQRLRDLLFSLHQRQAQIPGNQCTILVDLAIEQMTTGHPTTHPFITEQVQRRCGLCRETLNMIIRKFPRKIKHPQTHATTFKCHSTLLKRLLFAAHSRASASI